MVAVDSIINRNEKHLDLQFKVAASFITHQYTFNYKFQILRCARKINRRTVNKWQENLWFKNHNKS